MILRQTLAELFDSAGRTSFTHVCAVVLNCICSLSEAASDVISGKFVRLIATDQFKKFCGLRLDRSGEIRPKAVKDCIFDSFFHDNFRPEVASDAISGVTV